MLTLYHHEHNWCRYWEIFPFSGRDNELRDESMLYYLVLHKKAGKNVTWKSIDYIKMRHVFGKKMSNLWCSILQHSRWDIRFVWMGIGNVTYFCLQSKRNFASTSSTSVVFQQSRMNEKIWSPPNASSYYEFQGVSDVIQIFETLYKFYQKKIMKWILGSRKWSERHFQSIFFSNSSFIQGVS